MTYAEFLAFNEGCWRPVLGSLCDAKIFRHLSTGADRRALGNIDLRSGDAVTTPSPRRSEIRIPQLHHDAIRKVVSSVRILVTQTGNAAFAANECQGKQISS